MTTKRRRIVWLILLVPLYAACSMTYLGQSGRVSNSDWRTASREPVGLAAEVERDAGLATLRVHVDGGRPPERVTLVTRVAVGE